MLQTKTFSLERHKQFHPSRIVPGCTGINTHPDIGKISSTLCIDKFKVIPYSTKADDVIPVDIQAALSVVTTNSTFADHLKKQLVFTDSDPVIILCMGAVISESTDPSGRLVPLLQFTRDGNGSFGTMKEEECANTPNVYQLVYKQS